MYHAYINERYTDQDFAPYMTCNEVAENFEQLMKMTNKQILKTDKAFVTFELKGDALVIYDVYVRPQFRDRSVGRKLHQRLVDFAREQGKRVCITFSEFGGKNRESGIKAILGGGFTPAYRLENADMFIKGIQ